MSFYAYTNAANGNQTNTVWTGAPNAGQTAIVDGTETITVLGPVGQMISSAQIDIASGITLANDVYGNYDSLSRPQLVTHLDGTSEQTYYSCCGVNETVDRDGVSTYYYYDEANRQVAASRNGIVTSNILDSVGRTLETIRVGTDGSQIVLGQWEYDAAGRLVAQTNALGGVTTYVESSDPTTGGLIRTTTNPDGSTVIDSYFLDGTLKQRAGTAVHGVQYAKASSWPGWTSTETKLNAGGGATSESVTNFFDMVGRPDQTEYSDGSKSYTAYNSVGQLATQVDPDGVATSYAYDAKGEQTCVTLDPTNLDRVTYTLNDVTTDHGANVRRSRTYVCFTPGSGVSNLVSMSETSTTGLESWETQYRDGSTPVISESQTVYGTNRTVTSTASDGSYSISDYVSGMLSAVTGYDALGNQINKTTYSYDPHGRQSAVTDARNGTTRYTYNNADLVVSVTTPNPGGAGGAPQTTTTTYNTLLEATSVTQPDGTSVATSYLPTGEVSENYGSRVYPVGYSYDYAGRMRTMTNWSSFPSGGARVTTWCYNPYRGFLAGKTDAAGQSVSYSYTAAGRLASRTWARGTNTAYAYDTAGDLASVVYSDSTPGITNSYDGVGRISSVVCGPTTTSFVYDWANDVLSESYAGGVLTGLTMSNQYDTDLRRTNMALMSGAAVVSQAMYTYDHASRLASVSDGVNAAAYSYLANSSLVGQIVFASNGVTRMTTSKQYDDLNRLASIASTPSNSFAYLYNAANQRTMARLADSSYWRYGYDSLGQVASGNKYWVDETPVAGQQFDYVFDTIGNRTQTEAGGDQNGQNLRAASYTNNSLNQITSRSVPGYVDIMGDGLATNTVTVNGQTAYRKNEYFRQQLSVNNSSSASWTNITVTNSGATNSGHLYVSETPENYTYDADGNLLSDGRWNYTWDGENRLISMTSLNGAPSGSQLQLDFAYDYQGRRIQKMVSTNNGTSYVGEYTNHYAYDRWNCLAILNPSLALSNSFLWGSDLSGSTQGAGGVGGLVEVAYYGVATTNCFVAYDGNGNVSALINTATGATVANYDYGPFGEFLRASGPMAKLNPIRFSTKYDDDESDFLYYGYRYYNPSTGKWPSKDPINEIGFVVLMNGGSDALFDARNDENGYCFVDNSPISQFDSFGLCCPSCSSGIWKGKIQWLGFGAIIGAGYFWGSVTCTSTPITASIKGGMWPFGFLIKLIPGSVGISVSGASCIPDLVGKHGTFWALGVIGSPEPPYWVPELAIVGWTINSAN